MNKEHLRELIANDVMQIDLEHYTATYQINALMAQLSNLSNLVSKDYFTNECEAN